MRISDLSTRGGVPIPTIKFYLREGLLPPGTSTARNRAEYSESHLTRLRLVRMLILVGQLSVCPPYVTWSPRTWTRRPGRSYCPSTRRPRFRLDRTQPLLPLDFGVTEKRTHDYKRHGTTNLFAALDVATGTVVADCYSQRTGADFLAFVRKAVKPHGGKEIHVVLDNLSTHDTAEVQAWLEANPNVTFQFTPVGSSWMNQIEIWVRHHHPPGDPSRHVRLGQPPHRADPRLSAYP